MKFKEKSEFDIILKLEDVEGNSLRVEDTYSFKIYIWTANRLNHLVFSKRDINTKGKFDKITVPHFFMEALESGVISYTYDYSIYDKEEKEIITYDKVKEVYTDIVWRNSNFHQIPANPVNYQTLEYFRDLIEKNNDDWEIRIDEVEEGLENVYTKEETYNKDEINEMLETATGGGIVSIIAEGDEHLTLEATRNGSAVSIVGSVNLDDYATNESLESLKEDVESQIEEIKEDSLTEIETTIENIQTTVTENTESITSLQESVETLEENVETLQESKQDKLSAGDNIEISEDNVISVDLSEYAKTEDVESKVDEVYNTLETEINAKQDAFVTDIKGDDVLTLEGDIANGVLTITGSVDTYSKSDIDDKISEVVAGETADLENYLKKEEAEETYQKIGDYAVKSDFDSYYTKDDTDQLFATKEEIPTKVSELENDSEYVDNTSLNTILEDYAKTTDIPVVPTNVSAFTNDAGYVVDSDLTATLDNYATNSSVDDAVSTLEGEISKKQDQLTAGTGISIEDNVVTCTLDPEIFVVVSELPRHPESENVNKIHCVPDPESTEANNEFIEYLWVDEAWEIIGKFQPEVDLSDYQKTADADAKYATIADTYTKEEVENKIAQVEAGEETALEDYLKKTEAEETYQPIGDYATVTELNTKQDTLTSGTNITIDNNIISAEVPTKVSDLTNDTGYITDAALSDYAKTSDIPTKVSELTNDSNYVDSTTLSTTLEDYAKTTDIPTIPTNVSAFNNDSGYITEAALDGYAKEEDIPTKTSDLTNDSNFTTSTDLNNLKTELEEEITIAAGGGITAVNVSGTSPLTLEGSVSNGVATITGSVDLSDYAKTSDIPTVPTNVSAFTNDAGYITDSGLTTTLDDYYTKEETYTKSEIETRIAQIEAGEETALDNYLLKTEAASTYQPIGDYALKSEIPTVPTNISAFTNDSGYITNSALSDYVTSSALSSELSSYAKTSDIPTKTSEITNDSGFITNSDIPTNVSAFNNDSGYITNSALSDYAKTSDIPTKVSELSNDAEYVASSDTSKIVYITQSEYDSITPDANTLYLIPIE